MCRDPAGICILDTGTYRGLGVLRHGLNFRHQPAVVGDRNASEHVVEVDPSLRFLAGVANPGNRLRRRTRIIPGLRFGLRMGWLRGRVTVRSFTIVVPPAIPTTTITTTTITITASTRVTGRLAVIWIAFGIAWPPGRLARLPGGFIRLVRLPIGLGSGLNA